MYLDNDYIDEVTIEQAFIVFPGYLSHFVKKMRMRHELLLVSTPSEPEFLLHEIAFRNAPPKFILTEFPLWTQAV